MEDAGSEEESTFVRAVRFGSAGAERIRRQRNSLHLLRKSERSKSNSLLINSQLGSPHFKLSTRPDDHKTERAWYRIIRGM